MALEKKTVIDKIEIDEAGNVSVRRATYVEEGGVRISAPLYHRVAYGPEQDLSAEDARVQAIAAADSVRVARRTE